MVAKKSIFIFGCDKQTQEDLQDWMFVSQTEVYSFQNIKRIQADLSRLQPQVILINMDHERGEETLITLRGEEQPPLLVGISSGLDVHGLFLSMLKNPVADYYSSYPIERGFLDQLLAKKLDDPTIAQDRGKVDIKELTEIVAERDALRRQKEKLEEELASLLPERDRLQNHLAEFQNFGENSAKFCKLLHLENSSRFRRICENF